jgi:DNA-directed RNA polymerase specialized sigma subunit
VPGGKIEDEDLERENGRLVYAFEVSTQGKSDAQEVLVDANDGQVVSVKQESEHQDDQDGAHDEKDEKGGEQESGR